MLGAAAFIASLPGSALAGGEVWRVNRAPAAGEGIELAAA